MWNNVVNAWWQLVFYPATDAPRFTKGMIALIVVSVATLGATWLVWYLERREHRQKGSDSERLRKHADEGSEVNEEGVDDTESARVQGAGNRNEDVPIRSEKVT
jgi:MFS transporter, ACS family, pantothenate transporter